MPAKTSDAARARLNAIDKEYRASRDAVYQKYVRAFDKAMNKHKITLKTNARGVANLADTLDFPKEFHNDPDLLAAREQFLIDHAAAETVRANAARDLPYSRVRFQRMVR